MYARTVRRVTPRAHRVPDRAAIPASGAFGAGPTNDCPFLHNVVAHEVGHAIGLRHVSSCNGTKLMEPFIYTGYDSVRHDYVLGAHHVLFEFETELQGTYHLSCRGGTWLRKRLSNVALPSREHFLPLVNGDVNEDNTINIADFLLLRQNFGSSHPQADLNKDGAVSIADFLILRRNVGLSGD